jgi:hypothetical protein
MAQVWLRLAQDAESPRVVSREISILVRRQRMPLLVLLSDLPPSRGHLPKNNTLLLRRGFLS